MSAGAGGSLLHVTESTKRSTSQRAGRRIFGMGAIRFSLGRGTTAEEIDMVVERLKCVLA